MSKNKSDSSKGDAMTKSEAKAKADKLRSKTVNALVVYKGDGNFSVWSGPYKKKVKK
jgi:hypothetical protein